MHAIAILSGVISRYNPRFFPPLAPAALAGLLPVPAGAAGRAGNGVRPGAAQGFYQLWEQHEQR